MTTGRAVPATKPCTTCGATERYPVGGGCVPCARSRAKARAARVRGKAGSLALQPSSDGPVLLPELSSAGARRQARLDAVALRTRIRAGVFKTATGATFGKSGPVEVDAARVHAIRAGADAALERVFEVYSLDAVEDAHEALNRAVRELVNTGIDTDWIGALRARLMRFTPKATVVEPTRAAPSVAMVQP